MEFWNRAVFAGEEVQCSITFKNIANLANSRDISAANPRQRSNSTTRDRWKEALPLHSPRPPHHKAVVPRHSPLPAHRPLRSHRNANSISHPISAERGQSTLSSKETRQAVLGEQHGHKRALSIVSLGKAIPQGDAHEPQAHSDRAFSKPGRKHTRAASIQVLPWRDEAGGKAQRSGENFRGRIKTRRSLTTQYRASGWTIHDIISSTGP